MMTLNEIIETRRSIRKYDTKKKVSDGDITSILEAGRLAPSAKNTQSWHFTVVKNAQLLEKLAEACNGQKMVAEATTALVVWDTEKRIMPCKQSAAAVDCSIALSFMMLKATELGLGTCWLGAFDAKKVAKVLNLAKDAIVVAVTPLGYAAQSPTARPRKALEDISEIIE